MIHYTERLSKIESAIFAALENNPRESEFPLVSPVKNLIRAGGKRWRPLLLVQCAELAAVDGAHTETAYSLTPLVEFVHTASLVHDDIEDSSDLRRGEPAVHIVWGVDTALNAASWLYFKAAECIERAPLCDAVKNNLYALYTSELCRLHLGQAMDIAWHKNDIFPSVDEYMTMARLKTGTLASLAAKAGIIAGASHGDARFEKTQKSAPLLEAVGDAASKLGAAFQILDDVTNLSAGNPGKKRGDDVVEGKKSYIILTHLQARPADARVISECFQEASRIGIESPAVEQLIALVRESGTLSLAAQKARAMITSACGEFSALFPGKQAQTENITNLFENLLPKNEI